MKSSFPDIFILLIDNVLEDVYDKPVPRKDYLTFFDFFERRLSIKENEAFQSVSINILEGRNKWGTRRYNGKKYWKLDKILKTLQEKRILESTTHLAGTHSKRYYYSQAFFKELDLSSFNIIEEEINEKIYNMLKNQKNYDISNAQYKLLLSGRFSISQDAANEFLIENYKNDQISKESCLINIRRVNDLINKDIYVVRVENGRVFTSFNSLKKELRQFCKIDDEPLNSVDLKSSQPYLFAHFMLSQHPLNDDVHKFYDLVTKNDIYEWLILKNNEKFEEKITTRDKCKQEFFRYLFKKTNKGSNNIQRIFKSELPEFYRLVGEQKMRFLNDGSNLANYLQKLEADIFIPVCESFVEQGCLSVHDSLYFKEDLTDEVESALKAQFERLHLNDYVLVSSAA